MATGSDGGGWGGQYNWGSMAVSDLQEQRRLALAQWRNSGEAFPNDWRRTHSSQGLHEAYDGRSREELEAAKTKAAVAGRVLLRRRMGKAVFLTLRDGAGTLQVYVNQGVVGDEVFAAVDGWDLGDIVGCSGEVFKTRTGELSVRAENLRLLVKSLHPLPDKYHGLSDQEERARRRYVSLIANPAEREVFVRRAQIVRFIREYFTALDYLEVETPMLQPIPGGAAARPFVTHCHALGTDFYLRIAQELYIKRLLVGGFERVFEMNRIFRNEGISPRHNPEFTMLEFNAAWQDCDDFAELTEDLLNRLVISVCGGEEIDYQGVRLSFKRPFARVSPKEAILRECADIKPGQLEDHDFLLARLSEYEGEKAQTAADLTIGEMQLLLFEKCAEETLVQPTFLVDYPAAASPLARRRNGRPEVADRFELFVAGREIVNGFSELNDPELQAEIFRQQAEQRKGGDEEAMHYDADYVRALEYGLPPNAGGGIGIDRLVMLLTNQPSIRDVILFPQLRPESG